MSEEVINQKLPFEKSWSVKNLQHIKKCHDIFWTIFFV